MDPSEYYNQYAGIYFENTVNLNVSHIIEPFVELLEPGASILDLGCGSGRDSLTFLDMGFDVTALDGSEQMCELAGIHTDLDILHMQYEDLDFDEVFDGIWACASLIHLEKDKLPEIIKKISQALNPGGYFFMSLPKGDFEGLMNQRYFSEYQKKELKKLLEQFPELEIEDLWVTDAINDIGDGKKWLNVILRKLDE